MAPVKNPTNVANPFSQALPGGPQNLDYAPDEAGLADAYRPSYEQAWEEQVKLNSLNSLFGIPFYEKGAAFRFADELLRDTSQEKKIKPDELNKAFPGMNFSEELPLSIAASRAANKARQDEMKAWISRGDLGVKGQLTAGAMTGLDPGNVILGVALGGQGLVAKVGYNILGNYLMDLPTYALRKREGQDVNLAETLVESTAGGIVGTGVGEGLGIALRGTLRAGAAVGKKFSPETKAKIMSATLSQKETGAKLDVSPMTKTTQDALSGKIVGGATEYVHTPGLSTERALYTGETPSGEGVSFETDLGPGRYVTDDEVRVVNQVSNPNAARTGEVAQMAARPDAKLLDLDTPVTDKAAASIVQKIESRLGVKLEVGEGTSLKDVMDQIESKQITGELGEDSMVAVQAVAREQGMRGYNFVEKSPDGSKHNVALFFDKDTPHLDELGRYKPDGENSPHLSPDEAERVSTDALKPENLEAYNVEAQKLIEDISSRDFEDQTYLDGQIQAAEQLARSVLEREGAPADVTKQLEAVKEDFADDMRARGFAKALAECLFRNIT